MSMDELLFEYADTFDENFPMFLFRGEDEKKVKEIIQKCLDDGEPYKTEEAKDIKY